MKNSQPRERSSSELYDRAAVQTDPEVRRLWMHKARRQEVRENILGCTGCPLAAGCKSPVPFAGPAPALMAFVGEAPGKHEDEEGAPFVGESGKLLQECMEAHWVPRERVAVLNAVCCRPIGERDKDREPSKEEIEACNEHLRAQLEAVNPRVVVVMGETALIAVNKLFGLFKQRPGMDEVRRYSGLRAHDRDWVFTYHPAAALPGRDTRKKAMISRDIAEACQCLIGQNLEQAQDLFGSDKIRWVPYEEFVDRTMAIFGSYLKGIPVEERRPKLIQMLSELVDESGADRRAVRMLNRFRREVKPFQCRYEDYDGSKGVCLIPGLEASEAPHNLSKKPVKRNAPPQDEDFEGVDYSGLL